MRELRNISLCALVANICIAYGLSALLLSALRARTAIRHVRAAVKW